VWVLALEQALLLALLPALQAVLLLGLLCCLLAEECTFMLARAGLWRLQRCCF
jgi:hypothetical protein